MKTAVLKPCPRAPAGTVRPGRGLLVLDAVTAGAIRGRVLVGVGPHGAFPAVELDHLRGDAHFREIRD